MDEMTRLTHFGHAVRTLRAAFGRLFFAIWAGTFPDFVVKFLGAASMGVGLCDLKPPKEALYVRQ
jgi:hypothetical protein